MVSDRVERPWVFAHGLFLCTGGWVMSITEQIGEITERIRRNGIGLRDALAVLDMATEDQVAHHKLPSILQAFENLHRLINATVHGATIERLKPEKRGRRFHTLEIRSEDDEILGHLKMMYLRRTLPCYYLVYVEVTHSFRRLGLGRRILQTFADFLHEKRAVGMLDNIIPSAEPVYEIYARLGWRAVEEIMDGDRVEGCENYMVFIPPPLVTEVVKKSLPRMLITLRKKRPAIDMHDNEDMVRRTIEEFRSLYRTLCSLFHEELVHDPTDPLMRFLFTRLTTKLVGFRRRISALIGYTGGESLEQLDFSLAVKGLEAQPYSPWSMGQSKIQIEGDSDLLQQLPDALKKEPTFFIEKLPFYRRPYLKEWRDKHNGDVHPPLKIADLLDLGFDPTRLREFRHGGKDYIFERVSSHFLRSLHRRRLLLDIMSHTLGLRLEGTIVQVNPILLVFGDRGNVYTLRRKVDGIHSEEALDQLKTSSFLKQMNRTLEIDRVVLRTLKGTREWLMKSFDGRKHPELEDLAYFISWDIPKNIPRVQVDGSSISLVSLWIA
jgi:GNAT superfamily N-acetyltransferase